MNQGIASNQGSIEQLRSALTLIHAGRLGEARILCRNVLRSEPRNFDALQLLGQMSLQTGDYAGATQWLREACAINPSNAAVRSNRAVALLALGRPQEALQGCDEALRLKSDFLEAHSNRGNALRALDRPQEALASYERAIALSPRFFDAQAGRGKALLALGRHEEALSSCDLALQLAPRAADAWCLRGTILLLLRRPREALAAIDRALVLSPDSPEAHNNRGTALRDLRRPAEALAAYERALELRPEFAEVWCNVANIGLDDGKYESALQHCARALQIRPDFLDALNIRGTALRVLNRHEEAAETYDRILAAAPLYGQAMSHLLASRAQVCNWAAREASVSHIVERIGAGDSASAPHAFLWMSDSAAAQLQCATAYSAREFPPSVPLWAGERYQHHRIRVAYLSADFYDHPVAHLIAGVLERHDRTRFEILGVSLHRDPSGGPMHLRMQHACDRFYDAHDAGDQDVAAQLRDDKVDIVVDLTGHTRGGRMGILALRPAPIQVNYLGFTGTSGTSYVDYLIGDSVAIPRSQDRCLSEYVVRMPHSFLPNDDSQPVATAAPTRRDLQLPEEGIVFCAFNNAYKLNPRVFDVWMRLLLRTPGSVLWLRGGPAVMNNLRREAKARGVSEERLIFASRIEAMEAHLARYRAADLFLDTWPYGAHATARDALWAGLPVLTCAGEAFASRVAASLLTALGLGDLVTYNLDDYLERALRLAHSPSLLAETRATLARRRGSSPLFDTDLYRRHLESAYITMCERQRRGERAQSFDVDPLQPSTGQGEISMDSSKGLP